MTPVDDLISPDYRRLQMELHAAPKGYGGKGDKWAEAVLNLAKAYHCGSVLDYGCGQGTLIKAVRYTVRRWPPGHYPELDLREYDPAILGLDTLPSRADLVVCTDVIEHIEPEKLDAVLAHLASLARKVLFVVIATRPASKMLSDGRNAHLIVEDASWWEARLLARGFMIQPGPASPSNKPSREYVAVLTNAGPHVGEART